MTKTKLSNSAQATFQKLVNKSRDEGYMPNIKAIAALLSECGIHYSVRESLNVVEHRSSGRRYVNSRHGGKTGYKLTVKVLEPLGYELELDSSDSYYSWNTESYAQQLRAILKYHCGLEA